MNIEEFESIWAAACATSKNNEDNNTPFYFLNILHDEWKPETYRAVQLSYPDDTKKRFASGDPIADFAAAQQAYDAAATPGSRLGYSSDVFDFCRDGLYYRLEQNERTMRITTQAERIETVRGWIDNTDADYSHLAAKHIANARIETAWALGKHLLTNAEAQELYNLLAPTAQALAA